MMIHMAVLKCVLPPVPQVWKVAFEAFKDEDDVLVLMVVGPQPDALDTLPEPGFWWKLKALDLKKRGGLCVFEVFLWLFNQPPLTYPPQK